MRLALGGETHLGRGRLQSVVGEPGRLRVDLALDPGGGQRGGEELDRPGLGPRGHRSVERPPVFGPLQVNGLIAALEDDVVQILGLEILEEPILGGRGLLALGRLTDLVDVVEGAEPEEERGQDRDGLPVHAGPDDP